MTDVRQRSDHGALLGRPAEVEATQARLDAIIVPSARTAPYLREAARLARELNTRLVILCSKLAKRAEILHFFERQGVDADVIAVDLPTLPGDALPPFKTSELLNGTRLRRATDVSRKRNLAILLARARRWQRVLFLDDDIRIPDALDLRRATGQLDFYDAVGLRVVGCFDNSVVCHAIRDLGDDQGTFVGGGALVVDLGKVDGFFPDVYNEDWFYLLGDGATFRSVTRLGTAEQFPYDPYANPDRARREEFGDDLAEGLFAVLQDGGKIGDADYAYWKDFLAARHRLIEGLYSKAFASDRSDRTAICKAMAAALGRLAIITPQLCVRFLDALQSDRARWTDLLATVEERELDDALGWLGLAATSGAGNRPGATPWRPRRAPVTTLRNPRAAELAALIAKATYAPVASSSTGSASAEVKPITASESAGTRTVNA